MPHGDLLDLADKPKGRDRLELQKMAREHAMAVIRDYSAQPRMGVLITPRLPRLTLSPFLHSDNFWIPPWRPLHIHHPEPQDTSSVPCDAHVR